MKWLLDRCGTLLLRDAPEDSRDTLTSYKESMIRLREINASDCPPCVSSLLEGNDIALESQCDSENLKLTAFLERLNEKEQKVSKTREQKPRPTTRFERMAAIRRKYPGCQIRICPVDVDGSFRFDGEAYKVNTERGKYAPHKTRYGDQYDMDRILAILLTEGGRAFADQDAYMLEDDMITKIER